MTEIERRRSRNKIDSYFPDTGPLRRELYPKHMEFFAAGAIHRERLFLAANRVGKSEAGAYETSLHLTGIYPKWWVGKRFDRPIRAWSCGDTSKTVREIIQAKLLGPPGYHGTGMIRGDLIRRVTNKSGVPDAADTIYVRHSSGGTSVLGLKSYSEGREAFVGTEQHWIHFDEEADLECYTEALMRTMTTNGHIIQTFTPLQGLSPLVLTFLPGGKFSEETPTESKEEPIEQATP